MFLFTHTSNIDETEININTIIVPSSLLKFQRNQMCPLLAKPCNKSLLI